MWRVINTINVLEMLNHRDGLDGGMLANVKKKTCAILFSNL